MPTERRLRARLRRARARVRGLLQSWRTPPEEREPALPKPTDPRTVSRARFWAELREGQREAEAAAKPRS